MTKPSEIYGPGFTPAEYLTALNAGHETGWWDEHGHPAPWPEDFLDPNNGWRPGPGPLTTPFNPEEPPF